MSSIVKSSPGRGVVDGWMLAEGRRLVLPTSPASRSSPVERRMSCLCSCCGGVGGLC